MNFLTSLIDGIVGFVRRNPFFCLVVLLLAIFAPSVLGGIAMFVLYALLAIVLLSVVLLASFRWRITRMNREMEERFGAGTGSRNTSRDREGEVKIHKMRGSGEKRVSKDVGDYVEFEEVREKDEKNR